MPKTFQQAPRLIQRECGGWLARSNREDRLQIGVIAGERDEAASRYASALLDWERILSSDMAAL
jgi:hypothetical protein